MNWIKRITHLFLFALVCNHFVYAQTCDNPELLCFGNNFLNFQMDSTQSGLDAPCFTAHNSFYFQFFTNDVGGDVTIDVDIVDCVDSISFDTDLEIAIIESADLCNGPSNYLACNAASGGPISISATGLMANTTYYVQVDGDLNGPGITNPTQCLINPALSGSGVEFNYTASPDVFIVSGQSTQLGATGGTQYNWIPAGTLSDPFIQDPIASPTESTEYTVEIINGPCIVLRRVWVFVSPPITVYDAFTPNGDGFNDDWVIPRIENYPQCSVSVFDRWGQLVFKSVGYPSPWDGRRNDNPLTAGNYYYVIELNDSEINENLFTGSVTIIY